MKTRFSYEQAKSFLSGRRLPAAFIDLDAFDDNVRKLTSMLKGTGKTMRVASKSIRCVDMLKRVFDIGGDAVEGVMCFMMEEACFLSGKGFYNLLVAYPTVRKPDMELMVEMTRRGVDVMMVVDCPEHVEIMGEAGRAGGVELQAVIEVDMSYRPIGEAAHIGIRRSTVRSGADALRIARAAERAGGVKIVGIMGYEAQIAGIADMNPFSKSLNPVRKAIRNLSKPDVLRLRTEVVLMLEQQGFEMKVVNGGGTGSVDFTSSDYSCTEVAAGSGFYCPHLFSYYSNLDLTPAAFFALQVVRRPLHGMVTCAGGGYIASGETGPDRLPVPCLPEGSRLTKFEGAGEVQTPVAIPKNISVEIGDPVIFRHAKAGELTERFKELLLISEGRIVGAAPTYRGEGMCFM